MVIFSRGGGGEDFLSKKIKEAKTLFTEKFFKSGAKTFSTKERANTFFFQKKNKGRRLLTKKEGEDFFWTLKSPI